MPLDGGGAWLRRPRRERDTYAFSVPARPARRPLHRLRPPDRRGRPDAARRGRRGGTDGRHHGRHPGPVDQVAEVTPGAAIACWSSSRPSRSSSCSTRAAASGVPPHHDRGAALLPGRHRHGRGGSPALRPRRPPLPEEFTDDPWLILNALDAHAGSITGSSSAEIGLIDGLDPLAAREGTAPIFLMTDAETASFHRQAELWRWLGLVRPRVFTMQVGGLLPPRLDQQLMQDWAAVGGGAYDDARSAGISSGPSTGWRPGCAARPTTGSSWRFRQTRPGAGAGPVRS